MSGQPSGSSNAGCRRRQLFENARATDSTSRMLSALCLADRSYAGVCFVISCFFEAIQVDASEGGVGGAVAAGLGGSELVEAASKAYGRGCYGEPQISQISQACGAQADRALAR